VLPPQFSGAWRVAVTREESDDGPLATALRANGLTPFIADEVEAYVMHARAPGDIAGDWHASAPEAAVIASPRVAELLTAAVGADALRALRVVVSIGATTRVALERLGVSSETPTHADFAGCARLLADAVRREAAR
jgi:uroporphyrinogen-III synthase